MYNITMLLVNTTNYVKPYIIMYVGNTRFILQQANGIMLIKSHRHTIVYKYNTLLGAVSTILHNNISVSGWSFDHMLKAGWDARSISGYCYSHQYKHNIPYYETNHPDTISVFGFKIKQHINIRYYGGQLTGRLVDCLSQI